MKASNLTRIFPSGLAQRMPALYEHDGKGDAAPIACKWFDPSGSWTWYAIEGEPVTDEETGEPTGDWLFFGLVSGLEVELGYWRLSDLLQGGRLLPIERDLHWTGRTLGDARRETTR